MKAYFKHFHGNIRLIWARNNLDIFTVIIAHFGQVNITNLLLQWKCEMLILLVLLFVTVFFFFFFNSKSRNMYLSILHSSKHFHVTVLISLLCFHKYCSVWTEEERTKVFSFSQKYTDISRRRKVFKKLLNHHTVVPAWLHGK